MAPAVGTMDVSLAPLAPYGPLGSMVSTSTDLSYGSASAVGIV
jgi:hypothetical protein